MKRLLTLAAASLVGVIGIGAQTPASVPTPTDVKPGSITCEDVAYPHPVAYLPLTLYGQDVRMAYMDVAPLGTPNGRTVVLFHGNNFAGFYFGGPIDVLRKAGFRVVVPDQIGYGRSSKPIIPYNFHDWARNTRLLLQSLNIDKATIVGHSMGGMLAARFATQYPALTERLVLYNPIGLVDPRFDRPWESTDEGYKRTLASTYQTIRASIRRYVSHNPAAWTPEFETYTRIRYAWTLSTDWPRLAMVQALINQVQYLDPVVNDWAHITAPTLVFGGAEDSLPGSAALFKERMKFVADAIPNGNGRLLLVPGLGHVPHLEDPAKTYPPLLAFLQDKSAGPTAAPKEWSAADDHRNMMEQLGIRALRPGPSGNESAPNHANYDEAVANPFPKLPDPLTLKNGRHVASTEAWWNDRRPEIVEDFEREVFGRIPLHVPKVTWSLVETASGTLGGRAVTGKHLVGHVDNTSHPAIEVNIQLMLVTPKDTATPAPVMIMFRGGTLQQAVGNAPLTGPGGRPVAPMTNGDPPPTEQLVADGWGFAFLNPGDIQADNGAGLTKGIVGLVNNGRPRKPDDWGSLRAWSWGAARALDYLETDRAVDARRVGIEGVSRFGKAALVTMAFEPRFAVVLVGSSGEGGAKLHRRNFGEAVENLTAAGEYHWMAGNFMKYGAADAAFGSRNAGDLPVDAHELIALCAPRPTFISYGVPEQGDARWLDQQGSFMAAVAAGPVFRLLGARDLGTSVDYLNAKMPPVNVGLLDGQLAWRQHDGGHTDGPNWKHFIPWADRVLHRTRPSTSKP